MPRHRIRIHPSSHSTRGRLLAYAACIGFLLIYAASAMLASSLKARYEVLQTTLWQDRSGAAIPVSPNEHGNNTDMHDAIVERRFETINHTPQPEGLFKAKTYYRVSSATPT